MKASNTLSGVLEIKYKSPPNVTHGFHHINWKTTPGLITKTEQLAYFYCNVPNETRLCLMA